MPTKVISVGTTQVLALDSDSKRSIVSIANNHASAVVYWAQIGDVATTTGFPIFPTTIQTLSPLFGDDPTKQIWLISDTLATDVRICWEIKK